MISKIRLLGFALFLVVAFGAKSVDAQPKSPQTQNDSSFAALLERAKKSDTSLDFKQLRLAYTDTAEYSPYGGDRDSRQKMFAALNAKDYTNALQFAEKILAQNFLDMNAQFCAAVAHRQLGNTEKADLHKFLFEGLIQSVEKSGDGKTPTTAFVVISTDEEYVLLHWQGLQPTGQSLINQDGHSYDKMTAVNAKTHETVNYYFNIDKPFNWLGKSLKQ